MTGRLIALDVFAALLVRIIFRKEFALHAQLSLMLPSYQTAVHVTKASLVIIPTATIVRSSNLLQDPVGQVPAYARQAILLTWHWVPVHAVSVLSTT